MGNSETAKLAVLIDADNASASMVKGLLEGIAKYGTASISRAHAASSMLLAWPCGLVYPFTYSTKNLTRGGAVTAQGHAHWIRPSPSRRHRGLDIVRS